MTDGGQTSGRALSSRRRAPSDDGGVSHLPPQPRAAVHAPAQAPGVPARAAAAADQPRHPRRSITEAATQGPPASGALPWLRRRPLLPPPAPAPRVSSKR